MRRTHHAHRIGIHAKVFLAADVESCKLIFYFEAVVTAIAMRATYFLCLILISTLYEKSRIVAVALGAFWVTITMSSMSSWPIPPLILSILTRLKMTVL